MHFGSTGWEPWLNKSSHSTLRVVFRALRRVEGEDLLNRRPSGRSTVKIFAAGNPARAPGWQAAVPTAHPPLTTFHCPDPPQKTAVRSMLSGPKPLAGEEAQLHTAPGESRRAVTPSGPACSTFTSIAQAIPPGLQVFALIRCRPPRRPWEGPRRAMGGCRVSGNPPRPRSKNIKAILFPGRN